jgi:hypothetical protein
MESSQGTVQAAGTPYLGIDKTNGLGPTQYRSFCTHHFSVADYFFAFQVAQTQIASLSSEWNNVVTKAKGLFDKDE